ncbi:MAG: glutamine amidotransferase [Planctomycetota bacterium]|jgi:uncharacterized membrane protein
MFRWSFNPIGESYLMVGAAALALLTLLVLVPARGETTRGKRAALGALRLAIIVLVVLAMLRPTLVYTQTEKQSATLVVLVDVTRSMTVPDESGGSTRWETMKKALADAQHALARLAEDFEVQVYAFDAEARPLDFSAGAVQLEEPQGDQTAIGSVLEDVLREQAGKRLLGVILLSDGAQRAYPPRDVLPQTAANRLKFLGYPLYTVRFGMARGLGQTQDVALGDLLTSQQVYVKSELSVAAQMRVDGYVGRPISVQLLVENASGEMEPVDQENFTAAADGELVPVKFSYVPQLPGEYKISLEAVEQPGEMVTTNNRLSTYVNVLKGGLNVLYLEGQVRKEAGALQRALGASPDVTVEYVYINPRRPEGRPNDLPERLKPGNYEVYILGDLDASVFSEQELADLAETVSRGSGLIMLGGFHSFAPGGYSGTPLEKVLPIKMDRLDRQGLGEAPSEDLHVQGPLAMTPSRDGSRWPMLMLGGTPEENRAIWAKLPPLDGANRFDPADRKAGALILAEGPRGEPLLIEHTYGAGRVIAFAGDTTWHWPMRGFAPAHKRFWRQIILWLARKDESLDGNVWVILTRRAFNPGQRVEFTVGAKSAIGDPVEDASFQVEIELPDGSREPVRLTRGEAMATGSFAKTQTAGDHAVHVTATQGDEPFGTGRARFLVSDQDLELDNPAADATVMEGLAAITGGKPTVPEELPGLIDRLALQTEGLEVRRETKKTLWDTWGMFLVLVGLLGVEWYLRKRWGLV